MRSSRWNVLKGLVLAFLAGVNPALGQARIGTDPPVCAGASLVAELRRTAPDRLEAAFARTRAEIPNTDGLLWRVDRQGVVPSFLFGTKHSTDPRATDLPAPVREALRQARVVAVENVDLLRPGPAQAQLGQRFVQLALNAGEDNLRFLDAGEREAVQRELVARGLPAQAVALFRPWFLNVLLASPRCEQNRIAGGLAHVDAVIAENRPQGVELVGLETIDEQLETIRSVPEEVARHSLQWTARHLARYDDIYATLLDLYLTRNPMALVDVAMAAGLSNEADRALQMRFMASLGDTRDAVMAERAQPLLARGGAFIAVGALHLPGRNGLVERFRRAGWTVTRVW